MKDIEHRPDPDAELIQQVGSGDEKAFEQLVNKYQRAVFNTIYRYIGRYDDIEDIAQEVFIKVWRNAKGFRGKARFSTWLYRITVNQCLNYRVKNKKGPISLNEMIDKEEMPGSLIVEVDHEKQERVEIVRRAVNMLPGKQRMALILSKYEDKSYKEIAEIMGISRSAVESLIFRAKQALKKILLPMRKDGRI